MAYFVSVRSFASNEKGAPGARGWHIWRRGTTVFVRWGGILVRRHRTVDIVWSGKTSYKPYKHASRAAAQQTMKALITNRVNRERYNRLRIGHKIRHTAMSIKSVLKNKP
jgi:hypothetical protein